MLKLFVRMPIYRRLFLAFFLAVLIPDSLILTMSIVYTNALLAHGMRTTQIGSFTVETILAVVISTVVVIVLGYLMNHTITQPLRQLAVLARRIRKGETGARAQVIGHDEIAVVASSINSMLDQIVHLVQEAEGQRDSLQQQMEHLVQEVSGVGEGHLNIHAGVPSGVLGVLADSFNYMVEELSTLVIRVKQVTLAVSSTTTETQQEMMHLVGDAQTQLQQIGIATSTVDTMANASLQVAERTRVLDNAAREARQAAQNGRVSIQQTLEGFDLIHQNARQTSVQIERLGERSQHIDEIVRVLEDIAHQTNRLALDAAIQVAMAGETNKKGFGAVADDMRRLAEQTKMQLTTVSRNVKSVRSEIVTVASVVQAAERETTIGVERIQETGKTLALIFQLVEQQAEAIQTIHQMTGQVFHDAGLVAQTMTVVSEITQQNSQRTRAVATKMRHLTQLVMELRALVGVFQLKDSGVPAEQRKQKGLFKGREEILR